MIIKSQISTKLSIHLTWKRTSSHFLFMRCGACDLRGGDGGLFFFLLLYTCKVRIYMRSYVDFSLFFYHYISSSSIEMYISKNIFYIHQFSIFIKIKSLNHQLKIKIKLKKWKYIKTISTPNLSFYI